MVHTYQTVGAVGSLTDRVTNPMLRVANLSFVSPVPSQNGEAKSQARLAGDTIYPEETIVIGAVLAKREVRKGFDAINRHDLDTLVGMFAIDGSFEFPAGTVLEGRHEGTEAVRDWFGYWFERMPEIHFTLNHVAVENIFAMGASNVVYVEWDLDEIDTDGNAHHLTGVTAFDIVHGKVKSGKDYIFEQEVLAGIYPREEAPGDYPQSRKTP